jgi:aerobic-type carbon monoxide dehydrogenase small subunit (CoxS/CutS family)
MHATPASGSDRRVITLHINGAPHQVAVQPHELLLEVVREALQLTGTKRGCDMGTCGCCTVHVDGRPRLACLTLARECDGKEITTIEGLRAGGKLDPLQHRFADAGGSQCGFCTPGFVMTARALLNDNPAPTDADIREAVSGNLCRCTGYVKILAAIKQAAREEQVDGGRSRQAGQPGDPRPRGRRRTGVSP